MTEPTRPPLEETNLTLRPTTPRYHRDLGILTTYITNIEAYANAIEAKNSELEAEVDRANSTQDCGHPANAVDVRHEQYDGNVYEKDYCAWCTELATARQEARRAAMEEAIGLACVACDVGVPILSREAGDFHEMASGDDDWCPATNIRLRLAALEADAGEAPKKPPQTGG